MPAPASDDRLLRKAGRSTVEALRLLVHDRVFIALLALWFLGLAGTLWYVDRLQRRMTASMAAQGALLQARALEEFRSLYTAEVVERVRPQGIEATHDYATHPHAIPLPATLTIELGERLSDASTGTKVRLYSDYPFPWRQGRGGGPVDEFEREALAFLRLNPTKTFSRLEELPEGTALRLATADRMRSQCLDCHNTRPDSPKKDWKEGDVRGVLEVVRPLGPTAGQARRELRDALLLIGGVASLGLLGLGLVAGRLRRSAETLKAEVQERTREISERLRMEVGLRESESRLKEIFLNATDAIFLVAVEEGDTFRYEAWNPLCEQVTGVGARDVVGFRPEECLPAPVGTEVTANYLRCLRENAPIRYKEILDFPPGKRVWSTLLVPIRDAEGRIRRIGGFARDITDQQRLEAAELARAAAEEANRFKTDFLSTISHELRTPLNAIMLYSDLMLDETGDQSREALRSDALKIQGASRHLLSLVDEVLDLTKIEAGKVDLQLDAVDPAEVLGAVGATLDALAARRGNVLSLEAPAQLPSIWADALRLRQVLLNLGSNAAKFTEGGRITLAVRQEGPRLRFEVRDTGIGMTPEQAQRIFDAFVQAEGEATSRKYGGTGLGLSISRRLVELMGGELHVESEVGRGTCFSFSLPCAPPADGPT